jgi:two-component system CheB/CheR fusion protein
MAALMRACRLREESVRHPSNSIHQAWHDLKECLHVIQLSAMLLKSKAADADARNVTDYLSSASTDLQQVLNDLPDFARLEAGQEKRTIGRIDVAALLRDVGVNVQAAQQKFGTFVLRPGEPLLVAGDAGKVQRVAENVVRYAIKCLRPRLIELCWHAQPPSHWSFTVHASQDAGDDKPVIPERIGLSVARGFCRILDGTLDIDTTNDSVTFRVTLPTDYK